MVYIVGWRRRNKKTEEEWTYSNSSTHAIFWQAIHPQKVCKVIDSLFLNAKYIAWKIILIWLTNQVNEGSYYPEGTKIPPLAPAQKDQALQVQVCCRVAKFLKHYIIGRDLYFCLKCSRNIGNLLKSFLGCNKSCI